MQFQIKCSLEECWSFDAFHCREILLKKGSAVDAAIASIFCVGIRNLQGCGIGGGSFLIIYDSWVAKLFDLFFQVYYIITWMRIFCFFKVILIFFFYFKLILLSSFYLSDLKMEVTRRLGLMTSGRLPPLLPQSTCFPMDLPRSRVNYLFASELFHYSIKFGHC